MITASTPFPVTISDVMAAANPTIANRPIQISALGPLVSSVLLSHLVSTVATCLTPFDSDLNATTSEYRAKFSALPFQLHDFFGK